MSKSFKDGCQILRTRKVLILSFCNSLIEQFLKENLRKTHIIEKFIIIRKAISCHNLILIMSTQCNNTLSLELAAIVQYETTAEHAINLDWDLHHPKASLL